MIPLVNKLMIQDLTTSECNEESSVGNQTCHSEMYFLLTEFRFILTQLFCPRILYWKYSQFMLFCVITLVMLCLRV